MPEFRSWHAWLIVGMFVLVFVSSVSSGDNDIIRIVKNQVIPTLGNISNCNATGACQPVLYNQTQTIGGTQTFLNQIIATASGMSVGSSNIATTSDTSVFCVIALGDTCLYFENDGNLAGLQARVFGDPFWNVSIDGVGFANEYLLYDKLRANDKRNLTSSGVVELVDGAGFKDSSGNQAAHFDNQSFVSPYNCRRVTGIRSLDTCYVNRYQTDIEVKITIIAGFVGQGDTAELIGFSNGSDAGGVGIQTWNIPGAEESSRLKYHFTMGVRMNQTYCANTTVAGSGSVSLDEWYECDGRMV